MKNKYVLVYEFWAHDIATNIALETLDNLGIPYKIEVGRRLRSPSAPEGCKHDDWAKVYVEVSELAKWIETKIDKEISGC